MLLGQSPFRGDDEDEIFDAILEDEPLYPLTMPKEAVSLLQRVSLWQKLSLFAVPDNKTDSFSLVILLGDWDLANQTPRRLNDICSSKMSISMMSIINGFPHLISRPLETRPIPPVRFFLPLTELLHQRHEPVLGPYNLIICKRLTHS